MAITSTAPFHRSTALRSIRRDARRGTAVDDPDEQPTVLVDRSKVFRDKVFRDTMFRDEPSLDMSSPFDADSPDGITDAFTDELLDELHAFPTSSLEDVTEITEPGGHIHGPPADGGFDALEAQIPTLKTSREAPLPPVQPLMNRGNPTPVAPVRLRLPRRELSVEPPRDVQVSVEPPAGLPETPDATDITEVAPAPLAFRQPAPIHHRDAPVQPALPATHTAQTPSPPALSRPASLPVRWTLLDEYGWWLVGAVFGGAAGSVAAVSGLALLVMNGAVVL